MTLVLASTSPYRRELLARLSIPFEVVRPDADETPLLNESPMAQAQRLAEAKARSVANRMRSAWVIGSDQVAELAGHPLGKPGSFERAADQLAAASGQSLQFHTAVCVMRASDGKTQRFHDNTTVRFRRLTATEIERYLHAEQPYDCAGSFKVEGLGVTLFESIETTDPTALVGLPLIALSAALRNFGFALP